MEDNRIKSIGIKYAKINVPYFSLFELENQYEIRKKHIVNYQNNFNFNTQKDKGIISCIITVEIVIQETNEKFGELRVENIFEVENLMDILTENKEKNDFNIPRDLIRTILSISISTFRGILKEKLKGTLLQDEVYPLVDPEFIMKQLIQQTSELS